MHFSVLKLGTPNLSYKLSKSVAEICCLYRSIFWAFLVIRTQGYNEYSIFCDCLDVLKTGVCLTGNYASWLLLYWGGSLAMYTSTFWPFLVNLLIGTSCELWLNTIGVNGIIYVIQLGLTYFSNGFRCFDKLSMILVHKVLHITIQLLNLWRKSMWGWVGKCVYMGG